jgi:hypothetical protein
VERMLGKIRSVRFGRGGYQDAMMCLTLEFGSESGAWGVCRDIGNAWDPTTVKRTELTQWSEADRERELVKMCREISQLLKDAKVDDVAKLAGKPVECTFEGSTLKSFRILTEVL